MMSPPERPHQPPSSESSTSSSTHNSTTSTSTLTLTETEQHNPSPSVRLVLKKPQNSKKVNWTTETVDNEHMNKRKSKCCCIYRKPHVFGESSSESEDECENCFGHSRNKQDNPPPPPPPPVPPVS